MSIYMAKSIASRFLDRYIHSSWEAFFDENIINEVKFIENKLKGECFNPETSKVLRFLDLDVKKIKVIILGQDPYPQKGKATGRAFEVGGLISWADKFRQVSLKNILRLLYKTYNNITDYNKIPKFSRILSEINKNFFAVLPPNQLFDSWEKQGVLLLNTAFTSKVGAPGMHRELWAEFTKKLIIYISKNNPDICWFLWGKSAQEFKKYINDGKFFICRHPMMCSYKYEDDFLRSDCFIKTSNLINWLGK